MFKKILIANRGEIACRIIATCRKLGIETVAVYSEADAEARHAQMADEAVAIGPASPRESYLVHEKILEAARQTEAEAIHPGYGFLAESTRFAEAVAAAGLVWIGPRPQTIGDMGDKERARAIARGAGVPVLPGSPRFPPDDLDGLEAAAEEVGYPLLVKAAAGGGGIGMQKVTSVDTLRDRVTGTQSMAANAFGDGTIYLERFIETARHIEIQVFGFGEGHAVHFYERDCSVQRRFQKIIEESPAPGLPDVVRQKMATAATVLCHQERYRGAGTVEFVVDAETFDFYFLEMNTRIQVEHPVTEMATGTDLVALQIDLARRMLQPFEQRAVVHAGHAIECRIYAENPKKKFFPSPGPLELFDWPAPEEGVRIDSGFRTGDTVTPFYDPMIAKVIVHDADRAKAIEKMRRTLDGIRLKGITSNLDFLKAVLDHDTFKAGGVSTNFVDRHIDELI